MKAGEIRNFQTWQPQSCDLRIISEKYNQLKYAKISLINGYKFRFSHSVTKKLHFWKALIVTSRTIYHVLRFKEFQVFTLF